MTISHLTRFFFFFFVFFSQTQTFQGGFVNLEIVYGCDDRTYKSSSVWALCLLTQFLGLTTLQSLVAREALQGG